jgi:hypothetical protein
MRATLVTAGEVLQLRSELGWVDRLMREAIGTELRPSDAGGAVLEASVHVIVETASEPFHGPGWEPFARDAWRREREIVLANAGSSGFDLLLSELAPSGPRAPTFTFRWRPPPSVRAAAWALRSRARLLARATLLMYPSMWVAGLRGRVPLHACACIAGEAVPLLAGPSGLGKSTLVDTEVRAGGHAIGDNLCVGDGTSVWGVVEPVRLEGLGGRRMPHGRGEAPLLHRIDRLEPDRVVVLKRGSEALGRSRSCAPEEAARSLIAGTYTAGELRRYWGFAAALAAGTGVGPVHPAVGAVADRFAERLPGVEVILPASPGARLADLLALAETSP